MHYPVTHNSQGFVHCTQGGEKNKQADQRRFVAMDEFVSMFHYSSIIIAKKENCGHFPSTLKGKGMRNSFVLAMK